MKLALIGVGLVGGSFAKALHAIGNMGRIVGFDVDAQALTHAAEIGILDDAAASAGAAIEGADMVVVSTPVGSMQSIFREIAPHLSRTAIVTDTGSTKTSVIAAARCELGAAFERFVPGHPIAGSERSGVQQADAELFRGKHFIATPVTQTDEGATRDVEALWRKLGCRIERMTPEEHDDVFAAVSHLPHLLAFALVAQIASKPDAARKFAVAGAGFRDFTRIAASSPKLWADICVANHRSLTAELNAYRELLRQLQDAVERGDADVLQLAFDRASQARQTLEVGIDRWSRG